MARADIACRGGKHDVDAVLLFPVEAVIGEGKSDLRILLHHRDLLSKGGWVSAPIVGRNDREVFAPRKFSPFDQ